MEEKMKFFRTITLGAIALGFALGLAAVETRAQRSRSWGDDNRDYYNSQYRQRNWSGDNNRSWGQNYNYGRLSWSERRRLQISRYRMMQRNSYYNNGYNGGYYNSGRLSWEQRRRLAHRRNYYRQNNYYNNDYRRNW